MSNPFTPYTLQANTGEVTVEGSAKFINKSIVSRVSRVSSMSKIKSLYYSKPLDQMVQDLE